MARAIAFIQNLILAIDYTICKVTAYSDRFVLQH